jgi:hypothetical protein
MFTMNSREAIRTFAFVNKWLRKVYEATRWPLVLVSGCFPVKMITYLGEPIEYDPNRTPDELCELVFIYFYLLILNTETIRFTFNTI